MLSSINHVLLAFPSNQSIVHIDQSIVIPTCITIRRYARMLSSVAGQPWVAAIHRLLKAERRPDPRPKPGRTPEPIFWNGADLSAASGIRPNTLSDAMTGKREPALSTLLAIADALGAPPAALLMDADEAEAYVRFRQHHAAHAQSAAVEATVRRVLEERAEAMKSAWLDTQTSAVLADLGKEAPVADAPAGNRADKKRTA